MGGGGIKIGCYNYCICVWVTGKEVNTTDKPSTLTTTPVPSSTGPEARIKEEETPIPSPKKQTQLVKPQEFKQRTGGRPSKEVEKRSNSLRDIVMEIEDWVGCLPFVHSPLPPSPAPVSVDLVR